MEAEAGTPDFRRFWEVLTRLVGFKVESIESECGSKDWPDYFPGQRSHLENSKTRVRTGTSLEELPGRWLPRAYLGRVRGSRTESSGLGGRRPVHQPQLWLSLGGLASQHYLCTWISLETLPLD